jgi:hypothetical protein
LRPDTAAPPPKKNSDILFSPGFFLVLPLCGGVWKVGGPGLENFFFFAALTYLVILN